MGFMEKSVQNGSGSHLINRPHRHRFLIFDEDAIARNHRVCVDRGVGDLDPGQFCVFLVIRLEDDQFGITGQGHDDRTGIDNRRETASIMLCWVDPGCLAGATVNAEEISTVGKAE